MGHRHRPWGRVDYSMNMYGICRIEAKRAYNIIDTQSRLSISNAPTRRHNLQPPTTGSGLNCY